MSESQRIYLDNAATSWPKPEGVYLASDAYQRNLGAPAGRSGYREAAEVERTIGRTRQQLASLLGIARSEQVVFTSGGTGSLNLAIHGCLRSGDHVVTTVAEHNSVLRPLRYLQDQGRISVTYVPCNGTGQVDPDDVRQAITPQTRLIAMVHVSNVTGAIQPAREIGEIARERGVLFLLDVAQSLGHMSIDVERDHVDLLAGSCHKGLMGPLGLGVLYVRPGIEADLVPLLQGGTGTESEMDQQPEAMPARFESGNLNVVGIMGLAAALDHCEQVGMETIHQQIQDRTWTLREGCEAMEGVQCYGPAAAADCLGVVSMTVADYDPQELAGILDQAYSIQARAGLHCAPFMHRALGTMDEGGTLRLSPGWFTTAQEVALTLAALAEITGTTG